jgi:hypothetical protein
MRAPTSHAVVAAGIISVFFAILAIATSDAGAELVTEDWYVDGNEQLTNKTYEMRANLTINRSGHLSCNRVTFRFLSETPGQYGIRVVPAGRVTMDLCTIEAGQISPGQDAEPWTFYALGSAYISMKRCTVSDCGWMSAGSIFKRGFALETDNAGIFDCRFEENNVGLIVMSGAAPTVEDNRFEGNNIGMMVTGLSFSMETNNIFRRNHFALEFLDCPDGFIAGVELTENDVAIVAIQSNVVITNVSITGRGDAVKAARATVKVVNSTVEPWDKKADATVTSTVIFSDCTIDVLPGSTTADSTSRVLVNHSCMFRVLYEGPDVPVASVQVKATNLKDIDVWQGFTDDTGSSRWATLTVYEHRGGTQPAILSPFKLIANKDVNYVVRENFKPEPWTVETIYFVDSTQPALTVNAPHPGQTFNDTEVRFAGRATDENSGLRKLYYTVDGGEPKDLPIQARWEAMVILPEGNLSIEFVAEDRVGNVARRTVHIVVDITPPVLLDIDPPNEGHTRAYSLLVTGVTEPGARVLIGDNELTVDANGSFAGYVSLGDDEGRQVLKLHLVDEAGNENTLNYVLNVDRTKPALLVETIPDYRDFRFLNESLVTFFGTTEPGALVQVTESDTGTILNETNADDSGNYRMDVTLLLGENVILVDAYDAVGNRKSNEIISYFYDVTAPEITLLRPADGTVTKEDVIEVVARTEPEAWIWVNDIDRFEMPAHGEYEVVVDLPFDGNNTLTVYVEDKAGNRNSTSVLVYREVRKPDENGGDEIPLVTIIAMVVLAAVLVAVVMFFLLRRTGGRS